MDTSSEIIATDQNKRISSTRDTWKKLTIISFATCFVAVITAFAGVYIEVLAGFEKMAETSRGNAGSFVGRIPNPLNIAAFASIVFIISGLFFFFSLFRFLSSPKPLHTKKKANKPEMATPRKPSDQF